MDLLYESRQRGDAVALFSDASTPVTYEKLREDVDMLASYLEGAEKRLAFCLCNNVPEAIVGYLSFLKSRMAAVLLSSKIDSGFLLPLVETYRPHYLWCSRSWKSVFPDFRECLTFGDYVLLETAFSSYPIHRELAVLLTTSGSTGSPRFVRLSYRNLYANAGAIAHYLEIDKHERAITTLPMNYSYGLSVINSHFLQGASLILTPCSLMEKGFWSIFDRYAPTSLSGVPYTYTMLRKLGFFRKDMPFLRTMTQAGGRLSPEMVLEFAQTCARRHIRFFVMYGQTEATARMSWLPPDEALKRPASIGIPIPGGRFHLIDEDGGEIVDDNRCGELVYGGENVSLGYAKNWKDLSKGDENKGVLRTGDLARRDNENFYFIEGRKKRFIKVFGHRISLEEVESHIERAGVECACTGRDDRMQVFITDAAKEKTVIDCIRGIIDLPYSGCEICVIPFLPRNETGKILYANLC